MSLFVVVKLLGNDRSCMFDKRFVLSRSFLSDDEDDVQGLFDTPAPKKSTPAKKESEVLLI